MRFGLSDGKGIWMPAINSMASVVEFKGAVSWNELFYIFVDMTLGEFGMSWQNYGIFFANG